MMNNFDQNAQPTNKKKGCLKTALMILGVVFVLIIIIGVATDDNKSTTATAETAATTTTTQDNAAPAETQPEVAPEPASNWSYSDKQDAMTDKIRYFANCSSLNTIDFQSPYDGGSTLTLSIRYMNGKNEIMLSIDKGQFMSSYSANVKMKFDDGPIHTYDIDDPADGSSNYIFVEAASSIISNLRKARHVKIQPQFYQEGQSVFEFDVSGLEWKH